MQSPGDNNNERSANGGFTLVALGAILGIVLMIFLVNVLPMLLATVQPGAVTAGNQAEWYAVAVAIGALLITSIQAWYFRDQLKKMTAQSAQTEKQIELSTSQLRLSHNEYVSTNRPRIQVRGVSLKQKWRDAEGAREAYYQMHYTIVNAGGTVAAIHYCASLHSLSTEPLIWNGTTDSPEYQSDIQTDVQLNPGESRTLQVTGENFGDSGRRALSPNRYFSGVVQYSNQLGTVYTTAFIRNVRNRPSLGDFDIVRTDDPDCEFVD